MIINPVDFQARIMDLKMFRFIANTIGEEAGYDIRLIDEKEDRIKVVFKKDFSDVGISAGFHKYSDGVVVPKTNNDLLFDSIYNFPAMIWVEGWQLECTIK